MIESGQGYGQNYRWIAAALVGVSLICGAWLRLSGLEKRSITHPEMYVPGIPLPEGISEPAPRMTFSRILTGTFSSDTHPPGYYLMMLPWTRVMGTSLQAIRLPSALLGIGCILLIFLVGVAAGRPGAGALAAALLAFSGYHVFWSQVARMFALDCFLGLAATLLLLQIARGTRWRGILTAAYIVCILAGLATHVFFWSLFAVHMIWAFANAWGRRELPGFCRAQVLALVLGSPFIAFAAYQSGNTVAELSGNAFLFLAEFLPFAFMLPYGNSGFFPAAVPLTGAAIFWILRGALFLIAALLLVIGLRQLLRSPSKNRMFPESAPNRAFWTIAWIGAGLLATLAIGGFVYMTRQLPADSIHDTIKLTKALLILPFTITGIAVLMDRNWSRLPRPDWFRFLSGEGALLALLGACPFLILAAMSQARPLLNQRGLLFAAPFLLLLLSAGVFALHRGWIAVLLPVLALTCAASLTSYSQMTVDPADYAQFAYSVKSEIQTGDLVFLKKAWYETPILYYLRADRYRLVGRDYKQTAAQNPNARIWVVLLYDPNLRLRCSPLLRDMRRSGPSRRRAPRPFSTSAPSIPKPLKIRLVIRIPETRCWLKETHGRLGFGRRRAESGWLHTRQRP